MGVNLAIGSQHLIPLSVFVTALFIVGMAGAFSPTSSGGNPAVMGHSVDELNWSGDIPGYMAINGISNPIYKGRFLFDGSMFSMKEQNPSISQYPYMEWRAADNTRAAYLGWGSKTAPKYLELGLENGHNLYIGGGNVGIGTASPVATLHINAPDNTVQPAVTIRQSNNQAYGFNINLDQDVDGRLYLDRVVNDVAYSAMAIDRDTGNVGIGTGEPTEKLDVNGNIKASGTICDSNGCIGSSLWSQSGSNIYYNGGSVGIGTTQPSSRLHVYSKDTSVNPFAVEGYDATTNIGGILTSYGGISVTNGVDSTLAIRTLGGGHVQLTTDDDGRYMSFATGQFAERMRIDATGNVGIGTADPKERLYVVGNINATGKICDSVGCIGAGGSLSLDCYTTDWGAATPCMNWPEATPPSCNPGYTFVGIAAETHTDGTCGITANNMQKVKSRCCKLN